MKVVAFFLVGLLLLGCEDLPVKYEICDSFERNCDVYARFRTFDACEHHKQAWELNCDWSKKDQVICKSTGGPSSSTARCTR